MADLQLSSQAVLQNVQNLVNQAKAQGQTASSAYVPAYQAVLADITAHYPNPTAAQAPIFPGILKLILENIEDTRHGQ